jgi:hypothetical protein
MENCEVRVAGFVEKSAITRFSGAITHLSGEPTNQDLASPNVPTTPLTPNNFPLSRYTCRTAIARRHQASWSLSTALQSLRP